jgi:hypothetical protein
LQYGRGFTNLSRRINLLMHFRTGRLSAHCVDN